MALPMNDYHFQRIESMSLILCPFEFLLLLVAELLPLAMYMSDCCEQRIYFLPPLGSSGPFGPLDPSAHFRSLDSLHHIYKFAVIFTFTPYLLLLPFSPNPTVEGGSCQKQFLCRRLN